MAFIGMGVGLSFLLAMIIGPLLNAFIHVPGLFWCAALLGGLAILVLYTLVPNPERCIETSAQLGWKRILTVIADRSLVRLDFSIFSLHALLTVNFMVIPLLLTRMGISATKLGYIYIPVMLVAFLIMLPMLRLAETKQRLKQFFLGTILMLSIGQFVLAMWSEVLMFFIPGLLIFFTAFVFLEANLPALVTRIAPADYRGTASGVFSASQFLGMFVGGLGGGMVYSHFGPQTLLVGCASLTLIWFVLMLQIRLPVKAA